MTGKVALVTGGSRGMGAAIALRLAGEGADVAISYVSDRAAAEEVVAKVESAGRRGLAIRSDAADAEAAAGLVDQVAAHFGRLDILVNNAGVGVLGPMTGLAAADVNRVLDTNVRGVFLTTQAAASRLERGGRIISTGTALSRYAGGPGGTLYALSKSALTGMTKALARELGERAVTVNLIHPGPVDTAMNPADGPFAEPQRAATALGRFGTADEVASLVAYLAGDDAAYITGAELVVDGGHSA
ncbi:SDR family NAD(P)-dependent oxidoreductase [Streptomyces triticagri]|uniref:SDR family NAD(P)-dependent oxidoreductase n=2 Tax=Streptomyces triticagri TaxID=2293568 RepID=A0A372M6P3_9ACTN|nr:SDR family oxidoreductase [Streptomyces triticagri]RFU86618.1 SDR family NAD(P)-dependent oxidoreductase [Streptomyces triticagri]